ncbi:ankyrin repeat-containing protein NPR4-like [Juglans regia]|uniref:Ankyrin repeat-containing protein NPR4-like n=1 Tax=Juglans regia TaxID=51240 RepID=A0A6P9EB50_JUGRE|nr:ankyrin repeat-containing protein NPR4-like [Juglans regia]
MDTSHGNGDNTVALYEASLDGCVSTLNTLVQRDRLILHKISLTSFTETPLHIAALLGHLHFTNALLSRKPKLAEKVDSLGRTALHLACAEGHTQVVKALLQANADICLVPDQEERIPLHLAAMRGHIDYNSMDALKLLVESSTNDDFVNSKDDDVSGKLVGETRGTLMLVATVIATMTFQAGIYPPGGVWQQDTTNGTFGCNSSMWAAGTAILSYSETYQYFLSFNTTSFVAALTVVLMVTSGFPLRSKGFIWFLITLTMFIAFHSVVLAYINGVKLVNPTYFQDYSLITTVLQGIWLVLQQVLGSIHVIRFLFWIIRKLFKFMRRCRLTKRPVNDAINV